MFSRGRPKRIVAIDWDDRTLRVVHAFLGKRGVKIDRLLSVAIPPGLDPAHPAQMGMHIRRTLDQEEIATRHAIVDIPRDQAILKTLTLPMARPDELPAMVEIQIAKELPFPAKEAAIDFAVASASREEAAAEVLVAAIRCELLEQYEATFGAAGLKLDRIGLRPHANMLAACELLKHSIPERVLFIDVRPTFMEIDVLRNGTLAFSRSASVTIPKGMGEAEVLSISRPKAEVPEVDDPPVGRAREAREAAGVDGVIHSLLLEVTRSTEAYRASDPGAMIDHVVISGDVGVEEALGEAIQRRLDLTVELYNPASTFGWEPDEGAAAAAFAATLGLVLGYAEQGAPHFDFLHPKKTVSTTKQRLKKAPLAAAVVVLFAAAAGVALGYYTKPDRDRLEWLERRVASMRKEQTANQKFLNVVEEIREFDTGQLIWIDVLHDVFSLLPSNEEFLVNQVDMDQKDREIKLKTRCKNRETATEVIQALQEFRRQGCDEPRFKVSMGPQTEKKQERYAFSQDLMIEILDDGLEDAGSSRGASRR